MSLYEMPVTALKGFGKTRGQLFSKLSVNSVGDLVRFYPRTYSQWGEVTPISETKNGEKALIKATVCSNVSTTRISGGRILSKVTVCDESGAMELVFFNNKYISTMLLYAQEYCFYGKVTRDIYGFSMTSPQFQKAQQTDSITPVYNLTNGLNNRVVINAVRQALSLLPSTMVDPLPDEILSKKKSNFKISFILLRFSFFKIIQSKTFFVKCFIKIECIIFCNYVRIIVFICNF